MPSFLFHCVAHSTNSAASSPIRCSPRCSVTRVLPNARRYTVFGRVSRTCHEDASCLIALRTCSSACYIRPAMRSGPEHREGSLPWHETPSFYEPVEDAECVKWYVARVRRNGWRVGLYVPEGFEAYVRIPHPRWKQVPQSAPGAFFYHESWTRPVAFDSDETAYVADEGQLIGPWANVLFETLADVSSSDDEKCFCGLWEGYSVYRPPTIRFEIGMNLGFVLYTAPRNVIGRCLSTHRTACPSNVPSMIWPEDRSWCVVTPFQFSSTYLAGSQTLIERLLDRRDEIDVRVAHLDDKLITQQ